MFPFILASKGNYTTDLFRSLLEKCVDTVVDGPRTTGMQAGLSKIPSYVHSVAQKTSKKINGC